MKTRSGVKFIIILAVVFLFIGLLVILYPYGLENKTRVANEKPSQKYLNSAAKKINEGDKLSAIWELGKAIEVDPTCYLAYYGRGVIFFDAENYKMAIKDFNEAIKLNSVDPVLFL